MKNEDLDKILKFLDSYEDNNSPYSEEFKDKLKDLLEEIFEYQGTEGESKHKFICSQHGGGLLFRCPRSREEGDIILERYKHAICLGCEIEFEYESCRYSLTDEDGKTTKITGEIWELLPEINQELYDFCVKIGQELQDYRELKKTLKKFLGPD